MRIPSTWDDYAGDLRESEKGLNRGNRVFLYRNTEVRRLADAETVAFALLLFRDGVDLSLSSPTLFVQFTDCFPRKTVSPLQMRCLGD